MLQSNARHAAATTECRASVAAKGEGVNMFAVSLYVPLLEVRRKTELVGDSGPARSEGPTHRSATKSEATGFCVQSCRMYSVLASWRLPTSHYFLVVFFCITFIFLEVFWKQPTCRRIKYSHQTKRNITSCAPHAPDYMHTKPHDNSGSPAGVCAEPHAPGSTPCRAPIPPRLRRPPKA
jgi:hypothetical protein